MIDNHKTAICLVISAIPFGKVATYGQVADLAGLPRAARLVGNILRKLPQDTALPWHRVINRQGRISLPVGTEAYSEQEHRLTKEGIEINKGKVSLSANQWQP